MDALAMQNWEHVQVRVTITRSFGAVLNKKQFVFSHLNKLPKESHETDFSRIKPWYLDGQYVVLVVCSTNRSEADFIIKFRLSPPINPPLRVRDPRDAGFV